MRKIINAPALPPEFAIDKAYTGRRMDGDTMTAAYRKWYTAQRTPEQVAALTASERERQNSLPKNIEKNVTDDLRDERAGNMYNSVAGADALATLRAQRSPEAQAIVAKAMDQTQGINAQENAAIRQNALTSINSQNQGALRALAGRQAANGVRGGVAQAQVAGQRAQAGGALAEAERNLVVDNIKAKQEGLRNAATIVNTQENTERDAATDKLSTILAVRGEGTQLLAAQMQANSAGGSGGGK